jgi:multicomponent Na+:H+ antiporter subunit A
VALVALIFLLPWLGAALLPYLRPLLGRHLGRWALVPPAASLLITLTFVTSTSHDLGVRYTVPWFPMLGVNFSLWIDGLSVIFALLIAGMGLLITWYSHYYLDPSERQGRFYAYLLCFMGAMLGLVLSANLLTLFVFWELTSISSFLLNVFWGEEKPKRPRAVRHADLLLPTAFLVLITVALGLIGEPVFQLAQQAATQLFSRETYIEPVFAAMQGAK